MSYSVRKKCNLDGLDVFKYYWHDLRKELRGLISRRCGDSCVMVRRAISFNGQTSLAFIGGRENSENNQETLALLPINEF